MKQCKTCKQEKDSPEYYMYKEGNLHPNCKVCTRAKSRIQSKAYYEANKERVIKRTGAYRKANIKKMRPWYAEYRRGRSKTDLNFRLAHNLRKRISNYIAESRIEYTFKRTRSVIDCLGCSTEELIRHLEAHWEEGMCWDNYGSGQKKWQIDHTVPLHAFNLTKKSEFLKANHYTNLKPMWARLNLKKGKNLEYNVPTSVPQL